MKFKSITDLNSAFTSGEAADSNIFAEMRSNGLLKDGDHYKQVSDRILSRLQDTSLNQESKLFLTVNHIQVVVKTYVNNLLTQVPNVHYIPHNEKELADKKDAELCQAVWSDACYKQRFDEKRHKFANSFVTEGEVVAFVYFDQTKGQFLGYKQKTNEFGDPLFFDPILEEETAASVDELGQPLEMIESDEAVFSGELCIDTIKPTDLIRPSSCESLEDAEWLCIRKLVPIAVAESLAVGETPEETEELKKLVQEGAESVFTVLDGSRGEYKDTKGMTEVRYFYVRPCPDYPEGYIYITAGSNGILQEMPLPYGIFPIVTEGFDEIPSSPRHRSIIKPLRPVQVEINRLASQEAKNSIIFGDKKVLLPTGGKFSKGDRFDGMRVFKFSGQTPTIVDGDSGFASFGPAIQAKVQEMYKLANIDLELADSAVTDTTALLYRNLSQNKKYVLYAQKFERFLTKVSKLYINLAKHYYDDNTLIRAVGRREMLNIAEFRNVSEMNYRVKAVPVTDNIDSMMGRHLSIEKALQYAGDLPEHVRGQLIKDMPFLSTTKNLDALTLTVENIESDILALDRGEYRPARPNDKHELYIEMLTNRTKQGDFNFLPPQVQQMFEQRINEHQQIMADQIRQRKAMEDSIIPIAPPYVKVDIYENVVGKDGLPTNKVVKKTLPMGAIMWLIQRIEDQGQSQQQLEMLSSDQSQLDVLRQAGLIQPSSPQTPPQM